MKLARPHTPLRTKEMKATKTKHLILYQRVKAGLPSHQTDEKKKKHYARRNLQQLSLETSNQFATLANLNEESEFPGYVPTMKRSISSNNHCVKRRPVIQNASKTKRVNQKIVIIGDSHARNSVAELQHCLGSNFAVSSFLKPGAGMKAIVNTAKDDIMKLKGDDVVVIWRGSNDNGRNNSREAMKHLCNFVTNNQMVNTVVMTAPPRCDLLPSSCVNNEVIRFNRQLKKRMAPFNNVKILETNLEREYFTKHGLHLNSAGKECIVLRLAMMVKSFLNKKRLSPIRLKWKNNTAFFDLNRNNKESCESNCNAVAVPQSQP